jgi:hypothetical protein
MGHIERPEVEMLITRTIGLVVLFAVAACGSAQLTLGQQTQGPAAEPRTQAEQAQTGDFDGRWVGSGTNARAAFRTRCGNGPLIELTIQNGSAKGVMKFFVRRPLNNEMRSDVVPVTGTVDDHGRLDLTGHQATFTGVLSVQSGSGDGSWDVRTLACHGTFQVNHRP